MSTHDLNRTHGTLTDATTLRMQRRLPGPIERVWAYLTRSDLRQQWLASGDMPLRAGSSFELVWRNDELSDSASERPDGFSAESRGACRMIEAIPPRRLRYEWTGVGEVCFELVPDGDDIVLTLTHRRLEGEGQVLSVCAGWHAHLDRMVALLEGARPPSLWKEWKRLRGVYEVRLRAS